MVLAYEERGDGDPVVLIHGIGADRSRWAPAMDLLSDRYRCVAIDLPGHGKSPDVGCDVGSAANAIHKLTEKLELADPVVVGHSLGASVAFVYAAAFSPRSVVAVDPVALDLHALSRELTPMAGRLRGEDWPAAIAEWEARIPVGPLTNEQRAWIDEHSRLSREVLLSYWGSLLEPTQADAAQEIFTAVLSAITVPALVILGAQPSAADASMLELVGHATVELWDGIGHYPQIVEPERFADRVAAWVG